MQQIDYTLKDWSNEGNQYYFSSWVRSRTHAVTEEL